MFCKKIFCAFLLLLLTSAASAQKKDSLLIFPVIKKDSSTKKAVITDTSLKKHNPGIATLRSAIIPGWGQAYNKKYWKIPIIYGALGTTASVFIYNLKTYKALRQAFIYKSDTIASNDALIDSKFSTLSAEALRSYRNSFRQNVDYSVLFFLIFWGLNVADATVDAHLKEFDVSNDVSLKIKPGYDSYSNTTGISFVFNFKDKHLRPPPVVH